VGQNERVFYWQKLAVHKSWSPFVLVSRIKLCKTIRREDKKTQKEQDYLQRNPIINLDIYSGVPPHSKPISRFSKPEFLTGFLLQTADV
tara:strand:+ start:180 stop:446 length:267 start_codon:yes stop_codon:yes gene_type:complete